MTFYMNSHLSNRCNQCHVQEGAEEDGVCHGWNKLTYMVIVLTLTFNLTLIYLNLSAWNYFFAWSVTHDYIFKQKRDYTYD